MHYQRYVTTVVTNDAAVKIASTYNNPTSDIIMGYVTTEDIGNRDLYRGFTVGSNSSDLHTVNEDRAASYVKYVLDNANFAGTVKEVDVNLNMVSELAEQGKQLVKIDRFYASSQLCSKCEYKNADTKNLSVRAWDCPECGAHHDRDVNAAVNIRNEGMRIALA